VLAKVGEYTMTLLRTSASISVELRGDLRFQLSETYEDGPPPGFLSGHRQERRTWALGYLADTVGQGSGILSIRSKSC
jgi:hypothetical protein